jgi:multidrug resistance efflux pump
MGLGRWSVSLAAVIGLMAATVAAAVIWLLITDPVSTADAASKLPTGEVTPMVRAIGSVILDALKGLFKYL